LLAAVTIIALTGLIYHQSSEDIVDQAQLDQFNNWIKEHKVVYLSMNDKMHRFGIFKSNMELINAHNAKPDETYTVGINQFADLTFEEFSAFYLTDFSKLDKSATVDKCEEPPKATGQAPDSIDWTEKKKLQKVKNQGQCGSCWAFSAIGALEAAIAIKNENDPLDLSEQELVDCSRSYGNEGCGGGFMHWAYNYIIEHKVHDSKEYPYVGRNQKCQTDRLGPGTHEISKCVRATPTIDGLIESTAVQPVAAAFHVIQTFMFYRFGVYKSFFCNREPNHGIVVVGYDKTFKTPYFKAKNSWGQIWGDKGYFKIAHGTGKGMCQLSGNGFNFYPLA